MVDGLALFDLDPYGRELDDPLEELYQDLVHRLLEEPSSNLADLDRGVGINALLSSSTPIDAIASAISSDFVKDNRVQAVTVTQESAVDGQYALMIFVQPNFANLVGSDGFPIKVTVNSDGTISDIGRVY